MSGRFALCTLSAGFWTALFAYDAADFRIADYEPPSYFYRSLEITPGFSYYGSGSWDSSETTSHSSDGQNSEASGSLSSSFFFHRYSRAIDFSGRAYFDGSYRIEPGDSRDGAIDKSISRDDIRRLSLDAYDSLRIYYRRAAFYGLAASLSYDGSNNLNKIAIRKDRDSSWLYGYLYSVRKDQNIAQNPAVSFAFGLGWGRIRDVTFGAVALNMLDEVAAVTGKRPEISGAAVQDFAAYIESCKRRRVFDNRLSYIRDIEDLANNLRKRNVLLGDGTAAALALGDQWSYAFSQPRYSGTEFMVYPGVRYASCSYNGIYKSRTWYEMTLSEPELTDDFDWRQERTSSTYMATYALDASFRLARPLGRNFQRSFTVSAEAAAVRGDSKESTELNADASSEEYLYREATASASGLLAWYPNTRTTISFSPSLSLWHQYEDNFHIYYRNGMRVDQTKDSARTNCDVTIPVDATYYFSPQLSLSASLSLDKAFKREEGISRSSSWNCYGRVNLTYKLF